MSIYDFTFTTIEHQPASLGDYRGKVLLIVNTASKCGFTPQYEGLEKIYQDYRDRGLAVIGFPCNQFMGQEPGSAEDIVEFCQVRYGVTFPLSEKVDVRGDTQIPLFRHLTGEAPFEGFGPGLKAKSLAVTMRAKWGRDWADEQVKWNFTKFLVDKEGRVAGRFEPTTTPEEMIPAIEALL